MTETNILVEWTDGQDTHYQKVDQYFLTDDKQRLVIKYHDENLKSENNECEVIIILENIFCYNVWEDLG